MVLFTILLVVLAILVIGSLLTSVIGGLALIISFGDIIVCALIIIWICKKIFKSRNSKKGS